jgi:hypothetical protein
MTRLEDYCTNIARILHLPSSAFSRSVLRKPTVSAVDIFWVVTVLSAGIEFVVSLGPLRSHRNDVDRNAELVRVLLPPCTVSVDPGSFAPFVFSIMCDDLSPYHRHLRRNGEAEGENRQDDARSTAAHRPHHVISPARTRGARGHVRRGSPALPIELLILPSPAGREIVLATGAGIRSHEAAEPAGLAVHTTRPCLLLLDGHQFIFGLCRMKSFFFDK